MDSAAVCPVLWDPTVVTSVLKAILDRIVLDSVIVMPIKCAMPYMDVCVVLDLRDLTVARPFQHLLSVKKVSKSFLKFYFLLIFILTYTLIKNKEAI